MKLPKPGESGGDYTPAPAGTHLATCYRFIDLGTQKTEYNGQVKHQRKVILSWELCDELNDEGKPYTINQRYTWSMHEKATLRHHLEAWRGKPFSDADFDGPTAFDIRNVLGKSCVLTVVHAPSKNDANKIYANVGGVSKLMKGMDNRAPVNSTVYLSLESKDDFDDVQFDILPDYLKDLIRATPEYKAMVNLGYRQSENPAEYAGDSHVSADPDDDIPF